MSLARLVVHLQANYANLTSGLKVASNETVRAAQQITRSVQSITPETVTTLSVKAEEAAAYLENMAAAAELVENTVSSAAFSAEVAAGSFQKMASTATMVGNAFTVLDRSTSVATGGLQTAASVAHTAAPALNVAARASGSLSRSLLLVSSGARVFGSWMTTAGSLTRSLASGISHVAHSMHAAMLVTGLLGTAFSMLMVPIRLIGSAAMLVFNGMLWALKTVLLPLKLLWNGFVVAAQGVWGIVKPLASLGLAVAKVWFIFKGWIGSVKLIIHWLGMLPPKIRLLVGGLLALGLAGRAGSVAIRAVTMAASGVAAVAKFAASGVRLLLLPLQLIRNPAAAAATAVELMTGALAFAGRVALKASTAFMSVAASVGKIARQAVGSVASSFMSLGSAVIGAAKNAAVFGAGAAVWVGVKLAAAAETSRVVFGTMLHDMKQGAALLSALQSSKVAPFFDAKAIQDAGRDLLKAKVPVDQIVGRMEQLGAAALATKTPIEDLSRIYRQGMAKGAFQMDLINQMAERGVDIYASLTHVTGASGQALADMISSGKIGMAEMNAALDHMTQGHGIYAGVVDNVAKTTEGMWSTAVQNISMSLQTMFGFALEGNNGLLASFVGLTEQIKARAASIGPVIMQLTNVVTAIFTGLWDVVSTIWAGIFGETQATFSGMLGLTMEWLTKFRWYFTNLVPVTKFVWMNIALGAITAFNDIAYWFTDKLPVYVDWFANNAFNVMRDLAIGWKTIWENLMGNIWYNMKEIWNYIASGGTDAMQFAWTPLLEGFKATAEAIPNVPDRAMTALEESLQSQIQVIGTDLADSFDSMMTEANNSMAAAAAVTPLVPLQSTPAGGQDTMESSMDSGSKGSQNNTVALKGTKEAQAAIYAAIAQQQGAKDKIAQQQLAEQKKANATNQKIAEILSTAPQIAVVDSLA